MTELPNHVYFRPLAAKMRRCTVVFCLSLPGFSVRKEPKEMGAYLKINALLDMGNVQRANQKPSLKRDLLHIS